MSEKVGERSRGWSSIALLPFERPACTSRHFLFLLPLWQCHKRDSPCRAFHKCSRSLFCRSPSSAARPLSLSLSLSLARTSSHFLMMPCLFSPPRRTRRNGNVDFSNLVLKYMNHEYYIWEKIPARPVRLPRQLTVTMMMW